MSTTVWEFQGSQIVSAEHSGNDLVLHLQPFYILKSLAGSAEQTRWKQQGQLLITNAKTNFDQDLSGTIASGQLSHNAFVYRDEVPIPISIQGEISLQFTLEDSSLKLEITGDQASLHTEGLEKYVTHVTI